MKVILLDNVKKLGKRYETVNVKNGFAHNFLIPSKLAVLATDDALMRIESMKDQYEGERTARLSDMKGIFDTIADATITLSLKANEQGGLYTSVHAKDIAEALQ